MGLGLHHFLSRNLWRLLPASRTRPLSTIWSALSILLFAHHHKAPWPHGLGDSVWWYLRGSRPFTSCLLMRSHYRLTLVSCLTVWWLLPTGTLPLWCHLSWMTPSSQMMGSCPSTSLTMNRTNLLSLYRTVILGFLSHLWQLPSHTRPVLMKPSVMNNNSSTRADESIPLNLMTMN